MLLFWIGSFPFVIWFNSKKVRCNGLVMRLWHVIPIMCQWLRNPNINLDLFFVFNQTANIFYLNILYTSVLALDLSYNNLDITSYTLALALFKEKVLQVLQNQGQAACLMAGLQEKTIYRSALFLFSGSGARDAL